MHVTHQQQSFTGRKVKLQVLDTSLTQHILTPACVRRCVCVYVRAEYQNRREERGRDWHSVGLYRGALIDRKVSQWQLTEPRSVELHADGCTHTHTHTLVRLMRTKFLICRKVECGCQTWFMLRTAEKRISLLSFTLKVFLLHWGSQQLQVWRLSVLIKSTIVVSSRRFLVSQDWTEAGMSAIHGSTLDFFHIFLADKAPVLTVTVVTWCN